MTCSAPSALAFCALASSPTVVMTVQPIAFAILMATEPMPEPPACTRMVSPGLSLALSNSMCSVVPKAIGCTVITTVGDDAKAEKAKALGADHVINYKTERFEGVTRKLTAKKGVDVVFEHVGGEGFNASLFCLKRGGRLVTCGSTAGPSVTINLMQLFQQQYKIFGSFGSAMRNIRDSLSKIAAGMAPIIDSEFPLKDFEQGLARLESRQVFGKVIVNF